MTSQLMTFKEKKQDNKHATIAGAAIFIIGLALFLAPTMMLANQL